MMAGSDLTMRGGAGTFRGVDYQVRVAILEALLLIQRQILAPHLRLAITIEMLVYEGEATEKWDFGHEPPLAVFEAKVSPTVQELRDFLAKSAASAAARCELVFGEGTASGSPRS